MYVISGLYRYDVQYFVETGDFGDVVLNNSYKELAMEIQLNVTKMVFPQHISGVVAISGCHGSHDSLACRSLQMLQLPLLTVIPQTHSSTCQGFMIMHTCLCNLKFQQHFQA